MDIKDYTQQQGTFLKAEDVAKNPMWVITTEGSFQKSEKFGTTRLHLSVVSGDEQRTFDCSKTNARIIEIALGKDTKAWVGKKLWLETYKTKTSDGKMVEAINVKKAE